MRVFAIYHGNGYHATHRIFTEVVNKMRPRTFTFQLDDNTIRTARYVPMPSTGDPSDIVCSGCVPERTEMKGVADHQQFSIWPEMDVFWSIFECQKCKRFSVVRYVLAEETDE